MKDNNRLKFRKCNMFGCTAYVDSTKKYTVKKLNSKFYIHLDSQVPSWATCGFDSIESATEFLEQHDWKSATLDFIENNDFQQGLAFLLQMYGFARCENNIEFVKELPDDCLCIKNLGNHIEISTYDSCREFNDLSEAVKYIDQLCELHDLEVFSSAVICNPSETKQVVNAAISTRDLTKNLVRVKSSNMWAYTINIRDRKDKVGDVLVQFKGKNGGPGDIYLYYDVPVNLWRKWLAAPSKGHFFWVNVRNEFKYRKLTGNKRGVLPNAVN